ncbi:MAG: Methyltransferase domain-containing protein [Candidatus Nitrotoga sp. SPKER]|nr:MAG: Methyltransferase domain-containing protein [Candidatus Nitrotoga sp. SPKER]
MTISKKYLYNIPDDSNHAATKITAWINNDQEILEIGCASGIQTRHFKEHLGCRVTGIEIDPLAAEDARSYCESLIIGSIEELDLPKALGDKRFDAITLADVLEHLVDPARTLIKVRPFLKEGGNLIASIPNIAHAAICWELAHGRFDYQKFGLLDSTHIRFFTKKNIIKLFEETGYRIISIERVIKTPQETEFTVHCGSAQDQSFLDWICEQNPEAYTYQFIIKACLTSNEQQESSYQQLETLDTIHQLEAKISELSRQNMGLKSQIAWLENHRFGRLTNLVDRLRNKQQKKS